MDTDEKRYDTESEDLESDEDSIDKTIIRDKVTVVVLGDLGHSPRMNYHALSLSQQGFDVILIGLSGTKPQVELLQDEHITLTYMKPSPQWFKCLPRFMALSFKFFWQAVILFFTLVFSPSSNSLLLQSPPAVPTMPVCWLYCLLTRTKFFVDWHNYGYSILALSSSKNSFMVKLYRYIEYFFGRKSDSALCVTKQMKKDLIENWHVKNVSVHYDSPPSRFHPISDEEKHNFYLKMSCEYTCFSSSSPDRTVFTERFADGRVSFYEDRPALIVSSTSWTEDEDFSILLYALSDYEKVRAEFPEHYPRLIVAVTGKGPLKDFYVQEIQSHNWQHIVVITPWLSAEDYPKLLASADFGVCLHYSSSGLDLPMKVVDMFGCGLPVMAISFPALSELVKHNENGLVFSSKEELANLLQDWFRGFPMETTIKETYYDFYKNIEKFRQVTWHSSWCQNVLPLFGRKC